MAKARRQHTFTVTVSAPTWATRAMVRKEVRTLINDQANWGTVRPDDAYQPFRPYEAIEEGDIKVRRIS